jgi:beta-phosphoglucomutase
MSIQAVIFDLDGVIVSTDEFHYLGWKQIADEEGIPFDREINNRLRGVSRMESLEILLEKSLKTYSDSEKVGLATRKNNVYGQLLQSITPADILPGAMDLLNALRVRQIKVAIGSSSRNTPLILQRIGLADFFDAVADGNDITRSKPDPEVFLLAASRLGLNPDHCVVVEDARAGVEAAIAAGMKCVAVGDAAGDPRASLSSKLLTNITADQILSL